MYMIQIGKGPPYLLLVIVSAFVLEVFCNAKGCTSAKKSSAVVFEQV